MSARLPLQPNEKTPHGSLLYIADLPQSNNNNNVI